MPRLGWYMPLLTKTFLDHCYAIADNFHFLSFFLLGLGSWVQGTSHPRGLPLLSPSLSLLVHRWRMCLELHLILLKGNQSEDI